MITRNYANLPEFGQTHYRQCGSGQPLLMLHASPMSSEFMVPLMGAVSDSAKVIAPDTPGYGMSDSLTSQQLQAHNDLTPYVNWLAAFIEELGFDKTGLYGTATGAQIAIEFARTYPHKLEYLILDNAAHFNDADRQKIMPDYFPGIAPQADGSHLQTAWDMAAGVFHWFPWYQQDAAHQISNTTPPAAAIHATAMAYLNAGEDYAQAYKRAFRNEDASRVLYIKVPVRVIRWRGSVIKKYCDRYDDFDWPAHIQMRHCGKEVGDRYRAIAEVVEEFIVQDCDD